MVLLQVRIFPVGVPRDHDINKQITNHLYSEIQQEIPRQHQHQNLDQHLDQMHCLLPYDFYVRSLIRHKNRTLIGKEIAQDRICKVHQIDQPKMRHRLPLDQMIQKRKQRHPDACNRHRHPPVHLLIQIHQPPDLISVIFCKRLVKTENYRRTDSKLCQRQHTDDIAKQPIDAQIFRRQVMYKNNSVHKRNNKTKPLSAKAHKHVYQRFLCSHVVISLLFFES